MMQWIRSDRAIRRAADAMLVWLLISLVLGLLLPVYTDEVGWRFQLSRYFQDGGVDRFLSETCGANTNAAPPFFMLPVRAFSSMLTRVASDPLAVRLAGVAFAILGIVGMRLLVRRLSDDARRRAILDLLCAALLGLGVLPLLLVWSRPEQPVWLALLGSVLIACTPRSRTGREPIVPVVLVVLLALVAMSYHLKALIYLPVFALASCVAGRGSRHFRIRAMALALLAGAATLAYLYWSRRFACPGDPVLAAKLARENVSILMIGTGLKAVIAMAHTVFVGMSPTLYLDNALPTQVFMSDWLPGDVVARTLRKDWRVLARDAWYIGFAIGLGALFVSLRASERRWPPIAIALALVGCATIWAGLQLNKNSYESALYLPVLVLAIALAAASMPKEPFWLMPLTGVIAAISLASQIALVGTYGARLWATERSGYIAGQQYSLGAYGYGALRSRIAAAGAACGIDPLRSRRVMIDDLTYFTYAQSYRPVHRLALLSVWNGSVSDPVRWMRANKSGGAVIGCHYLPPAMRARAVATGPFCCVRPETVAPAEAGATGGNFRKPLVH